MLIWIDDHCALCPSDHKTWFSLGKCMCKTEAKQEGWTCLMPSPFPRVTDPVPWGWVLSATEKTLIHPFMGDPSSWPKHLLTLLTWGIKFVTPDLLGKPLKLSYRSRRRFSGKKKAPSERKYLAMEIWWGTGKFQSGLNNSEGVWVFHSQTVRYYHWPMALIYKCKKSCLSGTKLAARPWGQWQSSIVNPLKVIWLFLQQHLAPGIRFGRKSAWTHSSHICAPASIATTSLFSLLEIALNSEYLECNKPQKAQMKSVNLLLIFWRSSP